MKSLCTVTPNFITFALGFHYCDCIWVNGVKVWGSGFFGCQFQRISPWKVVSIALDLRQGRPIMAVGRWGGGCLPHGSQEGCSTRQFSYRCSVIPASRPITSRHCYPILSLPVHKSMKLELRESSYFPPKLPISEFFYMGSQALMHKPSGGMPPIQSYGWRSGKSKTAEIVKRLMVAQCSGRNGGVWRWG